ncbi:MAG: substrate-binding domain-containing protein [Pseudomonadota bacterium]
MSKSIGIAALAAAGLMTGLSASASAETIALVTINQQALFFNQINDGATAAAEEAGADLVIFNANNVPSAQNDAIETYISQGVDAIILVAIDVNGVKPAISQSVAAGIPVIAIDAQIPDGDNETFIGVDNTQAGRDIGQFFVDYVDEEMGREATVGIVGALNSFIQNQRVDGFVEVVEGSGMSIEILNTVDGQNVQDVALAAAENLMTANPGMDAIYASGEPALIGAVAAVESQGLTDSVKVFGWDLTAQAINGIDEGWVVAVVQQDPYGEGVAAVEAAMTLIEGGSVDPIVYIPIDIVTSENVDEYRGMFE